MTWLFVALSGFCFVVACGRLHSLYLDAKEAGW